MALPAKLPVKLVAPLAALIVAGVAAAGKGIMDIREAKSLAKAARARHTTALEELEAAQLPVHEQVAGYGRMQLAAVVGTLGRFADWVERNQMAVNRLGHASVDGVEVAVPELPELKNEVANVESWLAGGIAGVSAAAAAPAAALMGVSALAAASTGTAISTLSGAAATSATLAWLGGGSLAVGGGGIAAGAFILNLVAVAPTAFIGGITVAVIGSKQKTSAIRYSAEVNVAVANIATAVSVLPKVSERVAELSAVLESLVGRADLAIEVLETLSFDPDVHAPDFAKALQLVRGIREVVNTPLLDEETGDLTEVSLRIVRTYQ